MERPLPRALRVVAVIQLLGGLYSVADMLLQLMWNHVLFNIGVLGIPIYYGLRRLSSGWRSCALFFLWVGLVLAAGMFLFGLIGRGPAYFGICGVRLASIPQVVLSIVALPLFFFFLWQYRVLTRPDIRALFLPPTEAPAG